ncbi:MAG: ABC transporter ATP-binding protein [Deltaproteobacteria bacterium]|nr:ABC transporter ATP-binding protein [Deltaproteobacteria bacterium]
MPQPLPSTSSTLAHDTGNTATAALVAVRGLHKVFNHGGRELHVLRGINLTLKAGEMVAIVGRSGAGKSTMLHILGALDRPTRGEILFEGVALGGLGPARLAAFRNRNVGFVFQFHHLLPEFSALENVMMPCLIQRKPRREAEERALELLESVGLKDRLSHRPGELSGGEQQRVALARALAMRPKLLLADEPTGNLDSQTSGAMHELFFDLNERLGLTMMVVTHNTDLAGRMPRQLLMRDGKIEDPEDGESAGGREHAHA